MPTFDEYPHFPSRMLENLAQRNQAVNAVMKALVLTYPRETEVVQRVEKYLRERVSLRILKDMEFLGSFPRPDDEY